MPIRCPGCQTEFDPAATNCGICRREGEEAVLESRGSAVLHVPVQLSGGEIELRYDIFLLP